MIPPVESCDAGSAPKGPNPLTSTALGCQCSWVRNGPGPGPESAEGVDVMCMDAAVDVHLYAAQLLYLLKRLAERRRLGLQRCSYLLSSVVHLVEPLANLVISLRKLVAENRCLIC